MVDPARSMPGSASRSALINKEDYRGAAAFVREAVELAPADAEIRTDLGIALFENCEFIDAAKALSTATGAGGRFPGRLLLVGLSLERKGDYADGGRALRRAHAIDPQGYPLPSRMPREECLRAVEEARLRPPKEFDECLENVAIRARGSPERRCSRSSSRRWILVF